MYLFGFPEGLAGGSKETTYASGWNTSRTTTYPTNWNTYWNTSRGTSRNTTKTRSLYTHSYNWTPYYHDPSFKVLVLANGQCSLRYTWWMPKWSSGTPPAIGSQTTSDQIADGWSGYASKNYGVLSFGASQAESTLVLPNTGSPNSVNEGKIINTTAITNDYRNYGAFRIKIGPCRNDVTDWAWNYSITFVESLNLDGSLHWVKSFMFSPYTSSENYTASTSWSTVLNQTGVTTSKSTTRGTTYQTSQLTSHITYG